MRKCPAMIVPQEPAGEYTKARREIQKIKIIIKVNGEAKIIILQK